MRHRYLPLGALALLPALVGCPPIDRSPPEEDYTPAPYIYEEEAPPAAELEAADLEAAIDAAVAAALTLNAAPVFPAYEVAMVGAEATCPAYYTSEGNQYWYDQCTATSGTSFSGYSFYQLYTDYDAGDGNLYNGAALYGVAEIVTTDGYTFSAGGSAQDLVVTGPNYTYYSSYLAGSFAYDGPEAAGTWLAEGLSPDLSLVGYTFPEYGNYMMVDGGMSGMGGQLDTVVFDALVLYDALLGSTCPTEPGGVVSVRDDVGNWYDVVFDGPADYGVESDPELCDGCGSAYFRGEPLGEVCSDFSVLLDWEVTPW